MGRPTIPLEPYIEKLVQALLLGSTYDLAAQFAGVSPRTFARWRGQAATARPGTPLARLRDRLTEAEARAAIGWLAKIEAAASAGDWRAAAWKLSKRYPEVYGEHAKVDVTLAICTMARRVADEMGLTVDAVLEEAQRLLDEADQADQA